MNSLKKAIAVLAGVAVLNPFLIGKGLEDRVKENNHFQKIQAVKQLQEVMGESSWSGVFVSKDQEEDYTYKAEQYRAKALEVCADKPESELGRCFHQQIGCARSEIQRSYAQKIDDYLNSYWKTIFPGELTPERNAALFALINRTVAEGYHRIYNYGCVGLEDLDLSSLGISKEQKTSLEQEINQMCKVLGKAQGFYMREYEQTADKPFHNPCFDKEGWEKNCPGPALLPYTMDKQGHSYEEGNDEADFFIYKNIYHQQLGKIFAKYGLDLKIPLMPIMDPQRFDDANQRFLFLSTVNLSYQLGEKNPKAKREDKVIDLIDQEDLLGKFRDAGIPEQALEENKDLWDFLREIYRNEVVSANRTFYVTDKDGQKWILKTTQNERKARIEAAANYYLSQQFDFIVPGKQPEPLHANGVYMNLQRDVSDQPRMDQPLEYWIACLALFHREAEAIMAQYTTIVPVKQLRGIDALAEDYAQAKKGVNIKFDRVAIAEAIDYLATSKDLVFGHGDNKKGNRLRKYLVDLEGCGKVHPGVDLSLLLMDYKVPKDQWSKHLSKYLELRGYLGNQEEELKALEQGTIFAARYTAVKEVLGSSLRNGQETVRENQLLQNQLSYLS